MKLELTRNGPTLITETYADKVYIQQVMGNYPSNDGGPHCSGPEPVVNIRVLYPSGQPTDDAPWNYEMNYPQRDQRCSWGEHLIGDEGAVGCAWAHKQRGDEMPTRRT